MSGPEQTYQISLEKQLYSILEKHGIFEFDWLYSEKEELINALLKWRRA